VPTDVSFQVDISLRLLAAGLPNAGLSHRILAGLEPLPGVKVESLTPAEDA
jgi:hypothetical protein